MLKSSLFCPATGLRVHSPSDWSPVELSSTFTANFSVVGDSIIYSRPEGHLNLEDVRVSFSLLDKVAEWIGGGRGPYVQIEDLTTAEGTTIATRRFFAEKINRTESLQSLVFCNLSPASEIAVNIYSRFLSSGKTMRTAKHYSEALRAALIDCDSGNISTGQSIFGERAVFDESNIFLTPIECLIDENWEVSTPGFSNSAMILDRCVMYSVSTGYFEPIHVPMIDRMRAECAAALPPGCSIEYILLDSRSLTGVKGRARIEFMRSLREWHQHSPLRMYIICGGDLFLRTATSMAGPLMPFQMKTAKTIDQAFEIIRQDRRKRTENIIKLVDEKDSIKLTSRDVDKLLAMVGSISWKNDEVDLDVAFPEDHPFFYLFEAIKLVKEELEESVADRARLEGQLFQSGKMEALGRMAGAVAHRFSNDLAAVVGNLDLAIFCAESGAAVIESLTEAKAAAEASAELCSQMLTYLGEDMVALRPLDLSDLCLADLPEIQRSIDSSIVVETDFSRPGPIALVNDDQFRIILKNLVVNAHEAIGHGGGRISIATKTSSEIDVRGFRLWPVDWIRSTKTNACLEVADSGCGMNAEDLEKAFDPFFSTKFVGRGLGLAIALGIVRSWGGAIGVDSAEGRGSVLRVFLPLTDRNFLSPTSKVPRPLSPEPAPQA